MGDDLSPVRDLVDKMHRSACDLDAIAKRRFMNPQSIEARAAEGRNQRRMHIQNASGILLRKIPGENAHKARQNDHLNAMFFQSLPQGLLKARLAAQLLFEQHGCRDPGIFRPLQGKGPRIVGHHQGDLAAAQHTGLLSIQQGLQVGSAAGDQNRNLGFHSRITFSSFSTIRPMT